jgi:acyl-CoA synthetase (AMP-forming)/AMP-acid ligase II/acyl carrier protein
LAEATLAVTFPTPGTAYTHQCFNRHQLNPGTPAGVTTADSPESLPLMNVGRAIPGTSVQIAAMDGGAVADGAVGRILIRGANITHGYFEDPVANERAIDAEGWLDTGDLGVILNGDLYVTGRAKEIIFVNGQNYFPHDLEGIAQQAEGLELGKVVAAGCRPANAEGDELTFFVLHRGTLEEFLPIAQEITRLVNEHAGLEVAHVVPVKRIPKTTSGKIQRVALEQAFVAGEFAEDLQALSELRNRQHSHRDADGSLEAKILAICAEALAGKSVELDDNLFEIGASSLTLIQIHEEIDRQFPGAIDLTELFDYPTVAQLAAHLETKVGST